MTESRDFKALVRDRMAKTGERYAAARRHILRNAPSPTSGEITAPEDNPNPIRVIPPTWEQVVVRRFRTPEEAKAVRPAIDIRAILPVDQFVDITGKCEFPKNHHVTCQLETETGNPCDQDFGDGYTMRRSDGIEVFVGGICARKQFHDHVKFARETVRANNDVTTADAVTRLQELLIDPQLEQRIKVAEASRHVLYKQVSTVRECFTYTMQERIRGLAKATSPTISLEFEYREKREGRDKKIRIVSKWVPSVVAKMAAPRALDLTRFSPLAKGLHEAAEGLRVAEASSAHSSKTLRGWCTRIERVKDIESALEGVSRDLAAFSDPANLKGVVWLGRTLAECLSTTKSILRVLGQRTVTDQMARHAFGKWEAEMRAGHRNRNFRVP